MTLLPIRPGRRPDAQEVIAGMAEDLIARQGIASESAALRCLLACGYAYGDITAYCDQALAEARQQLVTAEMAK